jgi:type IX secretion system PorP/SprF family membrane protein
LYFNPAFAGSVEISRLSFSYRTQWQGDYQTGSLSYDQAAKKMHGGVGLLVYDDNSGKGILNTFYTGLIYAPKFKLSKKIALTAGIKAGYLRTNLNQNAFVIQPTNSSSGFIYTVNFNEQLKPANALDFSVGVLVNTENAYLGISADHLNQPNMSLVENSTSKLLVKYNFQAGYTFQKKDTSDFSLSINALYQVYSYSQKLQLNIVSRYKWFMLGAAYGNGITGLIGYYNRKFVVGYSLDYYYNLSKKLEPGKYNFAHEVSVKYFFKLKRKKPLN